MEVSSLKFDKELVDLTSTRAQAIGDLPYSSYLVMMQIRDFGKTYGRRPYRWEYGTEGLPEYDELLEKFDSYNRAMWLAGLKVTHPTPEDLIDAIKHFAVENQRPPTQYEVRQGLLLYGLNTFMNRFPSWKAVLLASGFHPPLVYTNGNRPSRRYLIVRLQRKARQLGRVPNRDDLRKDPDMPANSHYDREFSSLKKACEVARIREVLQLPEETEEDRRTEMIAYLQRVADYLGYAPSMREMTLVAKPGFGPKAYCRVFGSWFKALEAAGLETTRGFARYWHVLARRREQGPVVYKQVA